MIEFDKFDKNCTFSTVIEFPILPSQAFKIVQNQIFWLDLLISYS